MDTLTAARIQMEVSLGFHMVFAAVGMAMPLMMLIAEWRYLRTGDSDALRLAKTWAKVTAVLFAIGAVYLTIETEGQPQVQEDFRVFKGRNPAPASGTITTAAP